MENGLFHSLMKEDEMKASFMTYKFLLPFRLPLIDSSSVGIKDEYLFYFINNEYDQPASEELAAYYPLKLTLVEATVRISEKQYKNYPRGEKKRTKKDKFISEKFKDLLEIFNKMIVGLSLVSKNNSIHTITNSDLIGELVMNIYKFRNKKPEELERNIISVPFRKRKQEESEQIISQDQYISAVKTLIESENNSYYSIYEKIRESDRLYYNEKYSESIVSRNTVFEMFTTNIILRYEELVKNADETRLNNLSNKTPFANLIKNNLQKIIKVELNLENGEMIMEMIKLFMDTCSQYRHSIVHRGARFDVPEAFETLKLLDDIVLIVISEINKAESNPFVKEFTENNLVTKPHVVNETLRKYNYLITS